MANVRIKDLPKNTNVTPDSYLLVEAKNPDGTYSTVKVYIADAIISSGTSVVGNVDSTITASATAANSTTRLSAANIVSGNNSTAFGYSNIVLGSNSGVLGGRNNFTGVDGLGRPLSGVFILGNSISAVQPDTTYVQNLDVNNAQYIHGYSYFYGPIYTLGYSSDEWNTTYATVSALSASWIGGGSGDNTAILSLTGNWQNTFNTVSVLSASWGTGGSGNSDNTAILSLTGNWQSSFTTLCANSATWVKFQPNPEYLADDVSDALYNSNRYIRQNSTYYNVPDTYPNTLWIQKYGGESVWKIGYTSSSGDTPTDYTLVTSQNNATYPWQATWPNGTLVTKASAIRVVGQALSAVAAEGTSQWAARADHKHPFPTYSQIGAAAASHTHPISQIVNLQSNLDSKATLNPQLYIDQQVEEILVRRGGYQNLSLLRTTDPFVRYYGAGGGTTPFSLIGEACYRREFFYGYIGGSNTAAAIGWDGTKWIIRTEDPYNYPNIDATSTADFPWLCTYQYGTEVINNASGDAGASNIISVSPTLTIGEIPNSGTSTYAALADHQHSLPYQSPSNNNQNIFVTIPAAQLSAQKFNIVRDGYWPVISNRKLQYNYFFEAPGGGEDPSVLNNYNLSWTISGSVSAWKIIYTTDNQLGSTTTTVVASSLDNTTYPWEATWWPSATTITREYNVVPLTSTLSGSAGTSPYISRADHTHPQPSLTQLSAVPVSVYRSVSGNWQNTFNTVATLSSGWGGSGGINTSFFLPLSGGTLTGNLSTVSLSASNYFGAGSEVILSDGVTSNNTGNGSNTLSLNFTNGVFIGGNRALSATNLSATAVYTTNVIGSNGVPTYTYLTSNGSTIGTTPGGNFFGTQIDVLLPNSVYDIEYGLYIGKNTSSGTVTYTLSSNANITGSIGVLMHGAAANSIAPFSSVTTAALPAGPSMTSGSNYFNTIKVIVATGSTSTGIQLNAFTSVATITPYAYSYRKIIKIS